MAAERKEKYWGAEHNSKRREKYSSDPAHAERVREQRRESYARKVGRSAEDSCLENVGKVSSSGSVLAVQFQNSPFVIGRAFTQKDLAKLLNRQPQVIYRWHLRGLLPAPELLDDHGNRFFGDTEVADFIKILGEHQLATPHYRADHTDVTAKLFAASFQGNPERARAWIKERIK